MPSRNCPSTFAAALVAFALAACESTVGADSKGRFITNDKAEVFSTPATASLASSWKNNAREVFGDKWVGSRDPLWILDFIAKTESQGIAPCRELKAVELRRLELRPVTVVQGHSGVKKTYVPREYHESWLIEACGKLREWRILDDSTDPTNPLRVFLWKSAA